MVSTVQVKRRLFTLMRVKKCCDIQNQNFQLKEYKPLIKTRFVFPLRFESLDKQVRYKEYFEEQWEESHESWQKMDQELWTKETVWQQKMGSQEALAVDQS